MAERVGHVVVCGYESGDDLLLTALSEEIVDERTEVVIFALGDRPVDVPPRFNWVSGDVTKESELSKVNLDRAEAVIVVGKRSAKPQVADAITLLTLFTLRSFMTKAQERAPRKKPLYVVSEILDSENVAHAKEAGADEVIESTRLGFSLLAHTLVHHGAGNLISTVASAGDLSLYVGELPPDTTGCFQEVLISLRTSHGILAIGYRRAGQDYLNPEPDALLEATDHILYLSRQCVLSVPEN